MKSAFNRTRRRTKDAPADRTRASFALGAIFILGGPRALLSAFHMFTCDGRTALASLRAREQAGGQARSGPCYRHFSTVRQLSSCSRRALCITAANSARSNAALQYADLCRDQRTSIGEPIAARSSARYRAVSAVAARVK